MRIKTLALIHTVSWYHKSVNAPFVEPWLKKNPDVRVFNSWNVWSHEGAKAWRTSVHDWLTSLGEDRVRVTVEDIQVLGERPMLVASAVFRYAAVDNRGAELRWLQNRLTWALRPDVQAWKIVHEHTSLPVRGEDAKAIFQRSATPGV